MRFHNRLECPLLFFLKIEGQEDSDIETTFPVRLAMAVKSIHQEVSAVEDG